MNKQKKALIRKLTKALQDRNITAIVEELGNKGIKISRKVLYDVKNGMDINFRQSTLDILCQYLKIEK